MKKLKLLKSGICIVLVLACVLGTAGCGTGSNEVVQIEDMEIETPAAYSFDAIGGTDVMPIMGFYGPLPSQRSWNANPIPDFYTDEFFQLIADSGINLIGPSMSKYSDTPQYAIKLLEQSEKFGLGALVWDDRIRSNDRTVEEVDSYINEYSNYPSFAGIYMVDEPGAPYFRDHENGTNIDEFVTISQNFNKLDVFYYGNLLGMVLDDEFSESDVEAYEKYVREWIDTCHPKALMYDRYIYYANEGQKYSKLYFTTMEVIRGAAEEAEIPFWVFIEAGQQWNDANNLFDSQGYYPSKGEFYWNIGTTLAFGAKGIMYFPLLQPISFAYAKTDRFDFQRNGLIGAWGNKTRWYHYAQAMNAQIAAVDQVLMNSVNKGVIASGEAALEDLSGSAYLMEGTAWRELTNVTGDAMVGCFNYQGKTALYVVNYDTRYAQNITLDFADTYDITITQDAETRHRSCDSLELTFPAGGSALVVFE